MCSAKQVGALRNYRVDGLVYVWGALCNNDMKWEMAFGVRAFGVATTMDIGGLQLQIVFNIAIGGNKETHSFCCQ